MRLGLLVAVLLLYATTLRFPLVFDDLAAPFVAQAVQGSLGNQPSLGVSRALSTATFLWTYQAFGPHIEWFRAGNVLLHALNAVVLFGFLRRLFAASLGSAHEPRRDDWLAFAGALWFCVHPVTVYATAYLIQRSMLMATLFSLAALEFWLCGLMTAGRSRAAWLALAIACYVLALLSKEHAVMLPAVMLAMTLLVRPTNAVTFRWLSPWLVVLAALAIVAAVELGYVVGRAYEANALAMLTMQSTLVGRSLVEHAFLNSVVTQGSLFFKYLLVWLIPMPGWMSVDMHPPMATSWLGWPHTAGFLLFLAWPVAGIALLRQGGKRGLGGFSILAPWLLFATELATVRVQEPFVLYRSYLWMATLPAALALPLGSLSAHQLRIAVPVILLALVPPMLNRLDTFSTSLKLWDDAVSKTDERRFALGGRAWEYRGVAQIAAGSNDAALRDFDRALELDPWYWEIYANRAVARMHRRMWREALEDCDAALARNPDAGFVIQNREKIVSLQKNELENSTKGAAGMNREDGSSAHRPGRMGSF